MEGNFSSQELIRSVNLTEDVESGKETVILRIDETTGKRRARKFWVFLSYMMTILIPNFVLSTFGIKGKGSQIAWREKTTICLLFLFASAFFIWWIEVFPTLFCSRAVKNIIDLPSLKQSRDLVLVHGKAVNVTKMTQSSQLNIVMNNNIGKDLSHLFPRIAFLGRRQNMAIYDLEEIQKSVVNTTTADSFVNIYLMYNNLTSVNGTITNCQVNSTFYSKKCYYTGQVFKELKMAQEYDLQWTYDDVFSANSDRFVLDGKVYDLKDFMKATRISIFNRTFIREDNLVFPLNITSKLIFAIGTDATKSLKELDSFYRQAFDRLFYVGKIIEYEPIYCSILRPTFLVMTIIILGLVVLKFFLSLNFGIKAIPTLQKDYTILFVPCYTEGTSSLKKTIDSLARLDYDDKRKLLFVICDGNLTGSGNAKSTPALVLDILGYNSLEPEIHKYESLGSGDKSQNRGKVYCGYYHVNSHIIPYLVLVKVGNVLENEKPGNRGKRDSQLILMNFLNKINEKNGMLSPLEHEIFFCINTILHVNPSVYEFVLMVDADTEAEKSSLNIMIAKMSFDSRTIALCGETQVQNKFSSFTTIIQVYEYYLSHHLGKSFESLFGSVTCLPGCFSLYRIKSQNNKLFLADKNLIADYSVNVVETLHLKNLLHLGEDRYLTTLMLKYFPKYHLRFVEDAKCNTIIPDSFNVLLSQRRRWINSTIHNLFELLKVNNLCGWFIFSMKTVILLDLVGTILMPVSLLFFYFTIGKAAIYGFDEFSFVILSFFSVYVLQIFLLLSKRQVGYILWLLVYIVFSLPIFCIVLPLYAFWHFDDFSWGKTRKIQSDKVDKLNTELLLPPVGKMTLAQYMKSDPRYENAQLRAKPAFNSQIVGERKRGLTVSSMKSNRTLMYETERTMSPIAFSTNKYTEPDASPIGQTTE